MTTIPLAEALTWGLLRPEAVAEYYHPPMTGLLEVDGPPWRYGLVPLAEIASIETRTEPEHLSYLRKHWQSRAADPILLQRDGNGGLALLNGNHRLTAARAAKHTAIPAVIVPEARL